MMKTMCAESVDATKRRVSRRWIPLVMAGALGVGGMAVLASHLKTAPAALPASSSPEVKVELAPSEVTAEQLKERIEGKTGVVVAFVGSHEYFQERRIPGSICVPYAGLEANFGGMDRNREIVLYCGCCAGFSEGVSGLAARRLIGMGFRNVSHLRGHFAAWQTSRFPCEGTHPEVPEERAHGNLRQKEVLDTFAAESMRRRLELAHALDAERDPARKAELTRHIAEVDRETEIRGLELKRKISEENGDVAKVKAIDQMIEAKKKN